MLRRVLSLWQPWASLTVLRDPERGDTPPKQHETRSWGPPVRLERPIPVVIHATQTWTREVRDMLGLEPFTTTLRRCGVYPGRAEHARGYGLAPLPLGALIGVATIVSVRQADVVEAELRRLVLAGDQAAARELAFGHYAPGRWAWRLAESRAFPQPIPFSGRQEALYVLPVWATERVEEELAAIAGAQP